MYYNPCKICQQLKKRKTIYGSLPPKKIVELKPWDTVHVYLLGLYSKSIIQQQTEGPIIKNNVSLTCMKMLDPATGWFKRTEMRMYELNEVTYGND